MELKRKNSTHKHTKKSSAKEREKRTKKANKGEREEWKKVIVPCQQGKDIELHTHTRCVLA